VPSTPRTNVCHCRPTGSSRGTAAARRSCAIPENNIANVDAVSGGASINSPPFAVRCTVRPDTRRSISAGDRIGSDAAAAAPGASRDSSPAATTASISRSAPSSSGTLTSSERTGAAELAGATTRSMRERKLPERAKATSSVVPSNSDHLTDAFRMCGACHDAVRASS
jgi:hypothetical protein